MSKYRYWLLDPGAPARVLNPLNISGLKISGKREGSNIFHRRKLSGAITLVGDDFLAWQRVEESPDRCVQRRIVIDKLCGGQWIAGHWRGVFTSTDCKPNLDTCEVSIEVQPDDAYKPFLDNYSKEYNVLEVSQKITVQAKLDFDADFEFKMITGDTIGDQDDSDTWALFLVPRNWINGSFPQGGTREHNDIIFRLKRTAPYVNGFPANLSNEGWKLIDGNDTTKIGTYAKPPDLYNFSAYTYGTSSDWNKYPDLLQIDPNAAYDKTKYIDVGVYNFRYYVDEDRYVRLIWAFASFDFTRNRRLIDVIYFLTKQVAPASCPAVPEAVSQFFTAPVNYVTKQTNALIDLAVAQKTDITGYKSSEPATKGMLSLKSVLDELTAMFRAFWYLDASGKLRIEHESFFTGQGVFTFLRPEWKNNIKNTRNYEYNKTDMPRYQRVTFASAQNDDFLKGEIEYTSPCVNMQEGQDTDEVTVSKFTTDLKGMLIGAGSDKNGFVMLAHSGGKVIDEVGDITGLLAPNGHLAAANLVKHYYTHNRVVIGGLVNGKSSSFASVLKVRKQGVIKVLACCEVVNPFNTFVTTLGKNGSLDSWDESMLTGEIDFVVLHEAPFSAYMSDARAFNDSFGLSFG